MSSGFPPDLVTVEEAAHELGLSRDAVRLAIRRGVLEAVQIDRRTRLIPRVALEHYRREHLRRRQAMDAPRPATTPVEE